MRLAVLPLLVACGSSGPPLQGKVRGEVVDCAADCTAALRDYFGQHADARVAGVIQVYEAPKPSLIVWISDSDRWPAAGELAIENLVCDPSPGVPDCTTALTQTMRLHPDAEHAFLVPLVGPTPSLGTWSILDVRRVRGRGASWSQARLVVLPCRLEKGDPWFRDVGTGVMYAEAKKMEVTYEEPGLCEPALIGYLRAHPDERIAGVVPVAGTPAKAKSTSFPGTTSLVLLVGDSPWPRADALSVSTVGCNQSSCTRPIADTHPKLAASIRTLFTVPLTSTLEQVTRVGEVLVISRAP